MTGKIKCTIKQNNSKKTFSFNRSMTIKEIKLLILKRTEENESEGKKSDLNKSFDMVNQVRTSKILNNSLEYLKNPYLFCF